MTAMLVFDPRSLAQLQKNLATLPRAVAIRHLRIGLNAMGGLARDKFKATAARETGLLAKSAAVKVVIPDASHSSAHHGKPARVIVGPSRKVKRHVHRGAKGLRAITEKRALKVGATRIRKPTRYAHLAERKSPAIANAQTVMATTGMDKLRQKITDGITQEAAKLPK